MEKKRIPTRMPSPAEQFIAKAIATNIFTFHVLGCLSRDGRCLPYQFDLQKISSGDMLNALTLAWVEVIDKHFRKSGGYAFDAIYSPPSDALVLGALVSTLDWKRPGPHRTFWSGDGRSLPIMGNPVKPGDRVLVVATNIADLQEGRTAEFVKDLGGKLVGAIIPFDGQEKGVGRKLSPTRNFEQEHGVLVRAAATFADLICVVERSQARETLAELRKYRKEHCVAA